MRGEKLRNAKVAETKRYEMTHFRTAHYTGRARQRQAAAGSPRRTGLGSVGTVTDRQTPPPQAALQGVAWLTRRFPGDVAPLLIGPADSSYNNHVVFCAGLARPAFPPALHAAPCHGLPTCASQRPGNRGFLVEQTAALWINLLAGHLNNRPCASEGAGGPAGVITAPSLWCPLSSSALVTVRDGVFVHAKTAVAVREKRTRATEALHISPMSQGHAV